MNLEESKKSRRNSTETGLARALHSYFTVRLLSNDFYDEIDRAVLPWPWSSGSETSWTEIRTSSTTHGSRSRSAPSVSE